MSRIEIMSFPSGITLCFHISTIHN